MSEFERYGLIVRSEVDNEGQQVYVLAPNGDSPVLLLSAELSLIARDFNLPNHRVYIAHGEIGEIVARQNRDRDPYSGEYRHGSSTRFGTVFSFSHNPTEALVQANTPGGQKYDGTIRFDGELRGRYSGFCRAFVSGQMMAFTRTEANGAQKGLYLPLDLDPFLGRNNDGRHDTPGVRDLGQAVQFFISPRS